MKRYLILIFIVVLVGPFVLISQARAQVQLPSQSAAFAFPTPAPVIVEQAASDLPANPVTGDPLALLETPTATIQATATSEPPVDTPTATPVPTDRPATRAPTEKPRATAVPPTVRPRATPTAAPLAVETFARSIANGNRNQLVGVFAPQLFALRVKTQPANSPAYIYPTAGVATVFGMASQFGETALLAHNYLDGARFFALQPGQTVSLIYGDGSIRTYRISAQRRFRALSPDNPYSQFLDLDNGQRQLSSDDLFRQVYMNAGRLVFQTCIAAEGISSWGRLFVIADPVS